MKNILITISLVLSVVSIVLNLSVKRNPEAQVGRAPVLTSLTASTTAYTITTTSMRVMATSSKRIAATVQNINCTNAGTTYLDFESPDVAATIGSGNAVLASTSPREFNDFGSPIPNNSIQAIVSTGTCTVLVTEWFENF